MNVQTQTNEHGRNDTNIETLMEKLASKKGLYRQKARKSLVALGKPAVSYLTLALDNSKLDQLRWEAAKALNSICDTSAIPSLVQALEDKDQDVAWLAAEALIKLKKAAWPVLLQTLIKRGPDSVLMRQGAHHILRNQKEKGFNDLLKTLTKTLKLESISIPAATELAAFEILKKMETE
jgi:HEAT repeat protein